VCGIIFESLRFHLKKYEAEIKRKLFEIATKNNNTDIQERTINLLRELSEIRDLSNA
jgi:hypothetical protein